MSGLDITGDLKPLPEDAVTETFVILAKRGRGKTSTAVVMAEEMIAARLPVVAVDPTGVWWGLRSSASGQTAGLPVVIFGGDHADVPLEASAGALIADVLVEQRIPAVLDLSVLSKTAGSQFMTAFLERLYHTNRDPLHVIIDEADLFAPQVRNRDTARPPQRCARPPRLEEVVTPAAEQCSSLTSVRLGRWPTWRGSRTARRRGRG